MHLSDKNEFSQVWSQIPISIENKHPEHEALKAVTETLCSQMQSLSPSAFSCCQILQGNQLLPCSILLSWGPMTHTCRNCPALRQEEWWGVVHSLFNNMYWACTMCQSGAMLSTGRRSVSKIDTILTVMKIAAHWRKQASKHTHLIQIPHLFLAWGPIACFLLKLFFILICLSLGQLKHHLFPKAFPITQLL